MQIFLSQDYVKNAKFMNFYFEGLKLSGKNHKMRKKNLLTFRTVY